MATRFILGILLALAILTKAVGQSIPRNDLPRFTLKETVPGKRKGIIMVTFGVSMSDCIKAVEIENLANKRKYVVYPTLDHYYVRDSDMEEIFAEIPVGKIRKLLHKKNGLQAQITIISKSNRRVYCGKAEIKMDYGDDEEDDEKDKRTASK